MSSENFVNSLSVQTEDEESILSFPVAEDDDKTDDSIPEVISHNFLCTKSEILSSKNIV